MKYDKIPEQCREAFTSEEWDALLKETCPRIYYDIHTHPSPRQFQYIAVAYAYMARVKKFLHVHGVDKWSIGIISRLVQEQVPTYYAGKDLMLATMASKPPDMKVIDLRWPRNALMFMLPHKFFDTPQGNHARFIGVCKYTKSDSRVHWPSVGIDLPIHFDQFLGSIGTICLTSEGEVYAGWLPFGETTMLSECLSFTKHEFHYSPSVRLKDAEKDSQFIYQCSDSAIRLLLAMQARPDLVESGSMVKPSRMKKGHYRPEIWQPNFIGRKYVTKREHQGGTHASPKLHWRSGHFRNQPYGKKDSTLYKLIWIEPILIGAREEAKEVLVNEK